MLHTSTSSFAVILPAAGASVRFGADKLRTTLRARPVIARTLQAFLARPDVACVVVPTRDGEPLDLPEANDPRVKHCVGGASRAHSVLAALQCVPETIEWVGVHDAARPLVTNDLIDRTLAAAREHGAAAPAMPVHLTIKQATSPLPARVVKTVPRHDLFALQTPQIARRRDLLEAFARCPLPLDQVTDDMQLLELLGLPVWLVVGEERNLKITTPMDLTLAELLIDP